MTEDINYKKYFPCWQCVHSVQPVARNRTRNPDWLRCGKVKSRDILGLQWLNTCSVTRESEKEGCGHTGKFWFPRKKTKQMLAKLLKKEY